jgi:hypothetical protein
MEVRRDEGGDVVEQMSGEARGAAMADEHGRMIGGRFYKRFELESEYARRDRWLLVLVPEWCRDGWSSFKLFYDYKPARKRIWHLAVKNGRVTGGAFITNLEKHHPEALQWAIDQLKEYD